eukprot:1438719-Amphidinium_carterae.1
MQVTTSRYRQLVQGQKGAGYSVGALVVANQCAGPVVEGGEAEHTGQLSSLHRLESCKILRFPKHRWFEHVTERDAPLDPSCADSCAAGGIR